MQQAIVNYGGSGFGYWGYMEVNTDINLEGYDAAEISFGKHEGILNVADARWQKGKFVYDAKAIKPFAQNPWNVFGEGSIKQATANAPKPADYTVTLSGSQRNAITRIAVILKMPQAVLYPMLLLRAQTHGAHFLPHNPPVVLAFTVLVIVQDILN